MRFLLIAAFALLIVSCKNEGGKNNSAAVKAATDTANFTTVQWMDSVQDIGALDFGKTVQIKYHFKNTGSKPLFVISAMPGCGCTVADYPQEPIAPGKEGEVVASFDTNKGHPGTFNKAITVVTNTRPNGNTMLTFSGSIKEKPEEEKKPLEIDSAKTE
jgi:hypothetical protein